MNTDDTYRCVMDAPPPRVGLLGRIFESFRLNHTSRKRRRKRLRQWSNGLGLIST